MIMKLQVRTGTYNTKARTESQTVISVSRFASQYMSFGFPYLTLKLLFMCSFADCEAVNFNPFPMIIF